MKNIAASLLLFVGMITSSFAVTYSVNPGATYGPISYSKGNEQSLAVMVPSGSSKLTIQTWGGSGDADLFFKTSGPATRTSYTLSSTGSSTTETITVNNPASGWNYFTIYAYSNYSGLYFKASLQQTQVAQVATPVINPGGQSSMSPITVTMSCSTSGATIRYTTNGSDPTASNAIYPGAFTLSTSTTVKARAFKSGMTDSAVATTSYSIAVPSVTTLSNGSSVTGLSGAALNERQFKINVPSGQSKLEVKIYGGTGDADLYVKRASTPTTNSYDARPYLGGNTETATFNNPASGDWYIMVRAFSAYSGLSLVATASQSNTGWSDSSQFRHATTTKQIAIVAAALGGGNNRASPQSITGTPWLTDAASGDGARMRSAIQDLQTHWSAIKRPALPLQSIPSSVQNSMRSRLSATYTVTQQNAFVERIRLVFNGNVPTTDNDTLAYLGIRAQCKEFADRMVSSGGGTKKAYGGTAVANANIRPGMYAFKNGNGHAAVVVAVYWDSNNVATKLRLAESNWGTGWEANPLGQVPWSRVVTTGREVPISEYYVISTE